MLLVLILRMVEVRLDVESKNQITSSLEVFEAQIPRRCMTGNVHKETIRRHNVCLFPFSFLSFCVLLILFFLYKTWFTSLVLKVQFRWWAKKK